MAGFDFIDDELRGLREADLFRECRVVDSANDVRFEYEGKTFDNFCSNNYLGLANDSRVIAAAREAAEKYGAGAGAARLISGTQRPVVELEKSIAEFKGTDAALVFSSGYLANLGIMQALLGAEDVVVVDRLVHASLVDAARLSSAKLQVFKHNDLESLGKVLARCGNFRRRLIAVDGVFSMDGDVAPLVEICELAEKFDAMVLVDDAHGTGVIGVEGKGTVEFLSVESERLIQMGTLSKALGSLGGYVAGPENLIELIVNKARTFIFDTALPASAIAAAQKSLDIIQSEPERISSLRKNTRFVRDAIAKLKLRTIDACTPIVPIIIGDEKRTMRAAEELKSRGVFCVGIRPSTVPKGTSRLRITMMATHEREQLERLTNALKVLQQDGLI